MEGKILVTYATKHGATAEIAKKIAEVLQDSGRPAEVLPVKRVGDLGSYGAVILGSAVYMGQWRKEAATFLENHEKALAERPVWIFSSGPTGEGDPVELLDGWRLPEALRPVADRIQPRDLAVFGGALDAAKLSFLEKMILKMVKAPTGDFRDWAAITAWAQGIATELAGK
jgi:menaquinone-dependent protoporphyrinogen oxidase